MDILLQAFLGNLNPAEIGVIVLVVLLLFGASKIPKLMRSMGSGIGEFKKGLKESGEELASEEKDSDAKKETTEKEKLQ